MVEDLGSLEELPGAEDVEGRLEELSGGVKVEGSLEVRLEEPPRSLEEPPSSAPAVDDNTFALFSSLILAQLCRCHLFDFQLVDVLLSAIVVDLSLLCHATREFLLCELRNNACVAIETLHRSVI